MKSRVVRSVVFFLLCPLGSSWGQTPPVASCELKPACVSLYEQAQQQSKASQFAAAARSYKLAYEVQPDPRLLFSIGRALHKDGQQRDAASFYRRFLDSDIDDAQQKKKAQEYLSQLPPVATSPTPQIPWPGQAPSVASLPASTPPHLSVSQNAPGILGDPLPSGRPRWRLITGGVAIGTGLLLTGFGASALAAQGNCVDTPSVPAQTCDRIYTTTPVGGVLVGTGAAVAVGGIVLMAWPGK